MSDQTPNAGQPEPQKETPDLTAELREMGQQLEALFRASSKVNAQSRCRRR